jgi:hypothetical protein
LSRYCLPDLSELEEELLSTITDGDLGAYMGDLYTAWWVILLMAGVTSCLCVIYLVLLRCFAKPILYLSFVAIFVLLVGGGFYVYF